MIWAFSWILIPIAGILFGAFKEWLNFKEKQLQLGKSTENLEARIDELARTLEAAEIEKGRLLSRIQNLETIVTSQVWDAIVEENQPAEIKKLEIDSIKPKLELPEAEDEAAEKAGVLARRLRV